MRQAIPPVLRLLLPAAFLLAAPFALAADFVGSESCKACHPEAFTAWSQSRHARAEESLNDAQRKDARCLSCHGPAVAEQRVANVGCESCHGGGRYYGSNYVMKDPELARLVGLVDPSEKSCRACHDSASPSLRAFDFTSALRLIDHWTAERQRRDKQQTASAQ